MKCYCRIKVILLSALFTPALASGQNAEPVSRSLDQLRSSEPERRYRVGAAYRLGYAIPVTFKKIGVIPPNSNPGQATGTGLPHTYDNGYVLPDSRQPDIDEYTWNWGFNDASQVQAGQNTPYGSVSLESSSSPGVSHEEEDAQHGFELTFSRQIGKIRGCRWGVEGAFNYTDVSTHDRNTLHGSVTRVTDTYSLDGLDPFLPSPPNPPNTPYQGTAAGPGTLITDYPANRDVQSEARSTTITGTRKFDASVFGLRVGPYLEVPVSESVSLQFGGGFAVVRVDSDYKFNETASIAGAGSTKPVGSDSHGDWMPGGYLAGNISVALSKRWALSAGAQYMDVGVYKDTVNGQEVTMDLRQAIFVTLGISYKF